MSDCTVSDGFTSSSGWDSDDNSISNVVQDSQERSVPDAPEEDADWQPTEPSDVIDLSCGNPADVTSESVDPWLTCGICHEQGDDADLIICDECQRGYHTGCMNWTPAAKTAALAKRHWFCPECLGRLALLAASAVCNTVHIPFNIITVTMMPVTRTHAVGSVPLPPLQAIGTAAAARVRKAAAASPAAAAAAAPPYARQERTCLLKVLLLFRAAAVVAH
eukprot:gene15179-biopygen2091